MMINIDAPSSLDLARNKNQYIQDGHTWALISIAESLAKIAEALDRPANVV